MDYVSRAQWGAAYAQGSGSIAGPVLGVTLHWEGPHMGDFGHDQCARKVKSIERFHAVYKDWSGIAYNLLVCPHGSVYEGRGAGVRSAANGTSNIGGNDQWYAVCYLGGQGDGFTDAGKQGMSDAIAYLRDKGAGQRVNGHRDHHATECPGAEIYDWLKRADFDQATTEEDDMQLDDRIYDDEKKVTVGGVLRRLDDFMNDQRENSAHQRNAADRIEKAVDRLVAAIEQDRKA